MEIRQKEDGSGDIVFTEEEIKIINDNKKIYLSAESLRHFTNRLIKLVADLQFKFKDEIKTLQTNYDSEIIGKKPKDD